MKIKLFLSFSWEIIKTITLAFIIIFPIRYFIFQPFYVKGASMEPNFETGHYLIVDELTYRFSDPERGEVIVFKYPHDPKQRFIKRIIGLPGEVVEVREGQVFIYWDDEVITLTEDYLTPGLFTPGDLKITLEEDEYFVLGDNRLASFDSRKWGVLPRKNIIGRTLFRAWPFNLWGKFTKPEYSY